MKPDKNKPASAKKTGGQVFDVRRPGKAPASPTSRPVILGHKPEAQQAQAAVSGIGEPSPMLARRPIQIIPSGDSLSDVEAEEKKLVASSTGLGGQEDTGVPPPKPIGDGRKMLTITPSDTVAGPPELPSGEGLEKKLLSGTKLKLQPTAQTATSSEPPAEVPEKQPTETSDEKLPMEPDPSTNNAEAPTTDVTANELQQQLQNQPEPDIQPLFDKSGIVVSHHDHQRKHSGASTALLIILILVLAAATLDIALDLGVLNLPAIPHTDFFVG